MVSIFLNFRIKTNNIFKIVKKVYQSLHNISYKILLQELNR